MTNLYFKSGTVVVTEDMGNYVCETYWHLPPGAVEGEMLPTTTLRWRKSGPNTSNACGVLPRSARSVGSY